MLPKQAVPLGAGAPCSWAFSKLWFLTDTAYQPCCWIYYTPYCTQLLLGSSVEELARWSPATYPIHDSSFQRTPYRAVSKKELFLISRAVVNLNVQTTTCSIQLFAVVVNMHSNKPEQRVHIGAPKFIMAPLSTHCHSTSTWGKRRISYSGHHLLFCLRLTMGESFKKNLISLYTSVLRRYYRIVVNSAGLRLLSDYG